jgi:hypothetical protein
MRTITITEDIMTNDDAMKTPAWKIAAAWLIVGIPFTYGLVITVQSALKIFR